MSKEDGSFPPDVPQQFYKNVVYNVVELFFQLAVENPEVQKYRMEFKANDGTIVLYRPIQPDDDEKCSLFTTV